MKYDDPFYFNGNDAKFETKTITITDYKFSIPVRDAELIRSISINSPYEQQIHSNLNKLFSNKTYTYKQTLLQWLSYFKNNSSSNRTTLQSIIVGFTDYLLRFKDFSTLSQQEIENCCENFKIVLSIPIDFIEKKMETDVIVNIVLLAKHPTLQQCSLREALYYYNKDEDDRTLFYHLFCKHDQLYFLSFHFNYCTPLEVDLSMQLVQGKSLRKLLKDNFSLSKKETALFHTHPYYLWDKVDDIIEHYYCIYKLLKHAPEYREYINVLLKSCRIYDIDFPLFSTDIDFWKDVFLFLIKHKINDTHKATEFVDFFIEKRYRDKEPTTFSLKGRTLIAISRDIKYWHDVEIPQEILAQEIRYRELQEENRRLENSQKLFLKKNTTWKGMQIPNWQKGAIYIEEITQVERLSFEGNYLNHCVYTYLNDCLQNHTYIFSYHKKVGNKTIPILTIEVVKHKIKQVSGKYNRKPSKEEKECIAVWASQNNLITSYS